MSLKRKRSQHVSDDAGHSSGSDDEGDGDGLRRLPHGSAHSEHTGTDDADTDESEGENDGPSAHTRSHDKTSCAQGLVMLSHRFGKRNNEVAAALTTEYSVWLQTLPLIPRPLLDLHAIQLGRRCVVRRSSCICTPSYNDPCAHAVLAQNYATHCTQMICVSCLCSTSCLPLPSDKHKMCTTAVKVRSGQWQSHNAIFKLWDLGDSLDPIGQMHAEVTTYKHLSALQACCSLLHMQCCLKLMSLPLLHQTQ